MEKTVVITVHADPDYEYEIRVGEEIYVATIEGKNQIVNFASLKEMESVAKAILSAVKCYQAT